MKIEIDKPVVPQFVADWINSHVKGGFVSEIFSYEHIKFYATDEQKDWFRNGTYEILEAERTYILATCLTTGYEVEQPLYYAKIKGWQKAKANRYWKLNIFSLTLYPSAKIQDENYKNQMTKEEWNALGINETNADFEVVSEY